VYLYDTRARTLRAKCEALQGPAMRIDFSNDGAYVQVAGGGHGGHELLYFGAGDGASFSLPSQLKNVKWATWTSRLGWPVQGAWPKAKRDEASCELTCAHRSPSGDLLAAGYEVKIRVLGSCCIK